MGNKPSIEQALVRDASATKPHFGDILDDFRLYDGTRDALRAIAGGVEIPPASTPKAELAEFFKKIGPIFADVVASWAAPTPDDVESSVSKTDVVHDGVPVRILKSKTIRAGGKVPVVVYLHGGGFTMLSCKDAAYDGYLTRLAALGKCVVVAVDYRLSHTHPYPSGLDDCYNAVKWVAQGGAEGHGVPPGKVVVAGDSAGGNLAFATALKAKADGIVDSTIAGMYCLCPYFAGEYKTKDYPSMMQFDGLFISEALLAAILGNICDDNAKEEWFKSPLLWPILCTEKDMAGLPPCSTVVMELDMIRDMGTEMHYKLKNAGVESYLTVTGGGIHVQQLFSKHSPYVTEQSIQDLALFASYCSNK